MNSDIFKFDVLTELLKIKADSNNSISGMSRISSAHTPPLNSFVEEKSKIIEAEELIHKYARHWNETEENIKEYIEDQLKSYPLDDLLVYFRLLNISI